MARWITVGLLSGAMCLKVLGGADAEAQASDAPTPDAARQTVGQQAVHLVLQEYVRDPLAKVGSTGADLPRDGSWAVGKGRPAACPETTERCVTVFYSVPEAQVSCEWVVELTGDGSTGQVLEQNDDATRYLLRRLPPDRVAEMVEKRKLPTYPPIAAAAHVGGEVVVQAVVGAEGKTTGLFLVSGPPMLRSAAMDAAREWMFRPLLVGKREVGYQTTLTFDFRTRGPGSSTVTAKP